MQLVDFASDKCDVATFAHMPSMLLALLAFNAAGIAKPQVAAKPTCAFLPAMIRNMGA